jgi:hypothetical protein
MLPAGMLRKDITCHVDPAIAGETSFLRFLTAYCVRVRNDNCIIPEKTSQNFSDGSNHNYYSKVMRKKVDSFFLNVIYYKEHNIKLYSRGRYSEKSLSNDPLNKELILRLCIIKG